MMIGVGQYEYSIEEVTENYKSKLDTKQIQEIVQTLSLDSIQMAVQSYYLIQKHRIRILNQQETLTNSISSTFFQMLLDPFLNAENEIISILDCYTKKAPVGQWLRSIYGIGPVLAAGLISNFNPEKANYVSSYWKFAGLTPTSQRKEGQKDDFSQVAKTLCWKCADSFVKFHKNDKCFYGQIYEARKIFETARNDQGYNQSYAANALQTRKIKVLSLKECYESGKIPPMQIELRARRYAVKILLSHLWVVGRTVAGLSVTMPYIFEHDENHTHYIPPPNFPEAIS